MRISSARVTPSNLVTLKPGVSPADEDSVSLMLVGIPLLLYMVGPDGGREPAILDACNASVHRPQCMTESQWRSVDDSPR